MFVQGGVNGVAAAFAVQIRVQFQPVPMLIVVEPDRAACLLASAKLGELTTVPGNLNTPMADLACGEPSLLAWQELDAAAAAFMAIPDDAAIATMRLRADQSIVAGESGIAVLAGWWLVAGDVTAREALGLDASIHVLTISTEGDDPSRFQQLAGKGPTALLSRRPADFTFVCLGSSFSGDELPFSGGCNWDGTTTSISGTPICSY